MSSSLTGLSGLLSTYRNSPLTLWFPNVALWIVSLLLRRECCSFSNGEYVKAGLAELEHWIYDAGEEVLRPTGYVEQRCSS